MSQTARDERFAAAMLHARTIKQAAEDAGVPFRTACRLAADPKVKRMIAEGKARAFESACDDMRDGLTSAICTLREVAENEDVPPATRVYAAQTLLQNMLPYHKTLELEKRIAAMEDAIERGEG